MKSLERIDRGGSSGSRRSGPGVQPWCASSSCYVRSCRKLVALAGILGCAIHDEDCPVVGAMNVGGSGIGMGTGMVNVVALVNSYLEFNLRRFWSPDSIGVVRSDSSLLLLSSLVLLCRLCCAYWRMCWWICCAAGVSGAAGCLLSMSSSGGVVGIGMS